MNLLLAATAGLLFSIGTYLVIQRKLSRIIIGVSLLTHAANVLFIMAGRRGDAPIIGTGSADGFSDPLPQALALTAIVISFGVTAFLLALAYRSWILTSDDEVEDDVTDLLISTVGFEDSEVSDAESSDFDHDQLGDADEPDDSDDSDELDGAAHASNGGVPS